ncbi:MAG: DUF1566 domain-containing protein [Candidatus Brocadiaceae bacterium]|nr:DUF1566 domain-containing protein [Candidatus Brocadiaceae bacterium]
MQKKYDQGNTRKKSQPCSNRKSPFWLLCVLSGTLVSVIISLVILVLMHTKDRSKRSDGSASTISTLKSTVNSQNTTNAGITFRKIPVNELSPEMVQVVLLDKGFFDSGRNSSGPGFIHEFEILNSGKVVHDRACGLTWQQSGSQENMTFQEAKRYIMKLNNNRFADSGDWRLPTLEESMSLMEPTKKNGNLHISPLFNQSQRSIWTSDSRRSSLPWVIWFDSGYCDYVYNDSNVRHHVRAVR